MFSLVCGLLPGSKRGRSNGESSRWTQYCCNTVRQIFHAFFEFCITFCDFVRRFHQSDRTKNTTLNNLSFRKLFFQAFPDLRVLSLIFNPEEAFPLDTFFYEQKPDPQRAGSILRRLQFKSYISMIIDFSIFVLKIALINVFNG